MNKYKYIKKIFATISATAIALTALSSSIPSISAVDTNIYATQGTWGTDGKWVLSEDGTLTVTGTGDLDVITPKLQFVKDVKKLVVGEGITKISSYFTNNGTLTKYLNEIVLPSTLKDLNSFSIKGNAIMDVYIYSKNITIDKSNSGMLPNPGSGVIMHLYKDSDTEKNFRTLYNYTEDDIAYIEGDRPEELEPVPAVIAELTETSGFSGLSSKWEWDETSKTLTFSGKGSISIADYYKNYAEETEHIIIEEGITDLNANTGILSSGVIASDFSGSFTGFTALKDVQLPNGITEISDCSFCGDTSLEEINFPDSLNKIGECAFEFTNIKSLNLKEGMEIGGKAFRRCNSLKELTIPKNIAFRPVYFNANGLARASSTFIECTGLEKVVIEDGSVLLNGFNYVYTQNGLPENFFSNCTSLKTVIIKGNVEDIARNAFGERNSTLGGCASLTDIYFYNTGLKTITEKDFHTRSNVYGDSIDTTNNPTFHVVKGSQTEQTLRDAGYLDNNNTEYLPDITTLETVIADAEKIDATKYTDNSLINNFKTALEKAKSVRDNLDATQNDVDAAVKALNDAISALTKPNTSVTPTSPTTKPSTTRSAEVVKKDKTTAENLMKQAKITKLTVKSKSKKKINVSWKKVKTAVGYQVQVSKKSNFKKRILNKFTTKKKLTINKKIKSGKTYFVRVRAYATYKDAFGKPQKVYSKWNKKLRKVKVK